MLNLASNRVVRPVCDGTLLVEYTVRPTNINAPTGPLDFFFFQLLKVHLGPVHDPMRGHLDAGSV